MNRRLLFFVLAVLLCLAALSTVFLQRARLTALRAEQSQLLAESASSTPAEITPTVPAAPAPAVSSELLRLRSEVTRLTRQRDELGSVAVENQRLRVQAANHATNTTTGIPLPDGYLRASQARMAGYNTPEETVESFLWAVYHHDLTNLLQAFTPETARDLQKRAGELGERLEASFHIPGLSILERKHMPDGTVRLKMETAPGVPEGFQFRQINGQWKIDMGAGGRQ